MNKSKFLGEFEQFVLLAILKLNEQAYGARIRQLLADEIERDVSIGALYTTLERLEKKGMLTSQLGEASAERGGRAKKYFQVSGEGKRALNQSKSAIDRMWRDVALSEVPLCQ